MLYTTEMYFLRIKKNVFGLALGSSSYKKCFLKLNMKDDDLFSSIIYTGLFKGEDECITLGVAAPGENDYSNKLLSFTVDLIVFAIYHTKIFLLLFFMSEKG